MIKLILSFFLILLLNINLNNGAVIENFHMITLVSDRVSDLGFNNMLNDARVRVDKYLKIEDSRLYVVDGYNETKDLLLPIVQNEEVNLVLCTSVSHTDACTELANMYLNTGVKTQFMVRGSQAVTDNLIQITYNFAGVNYISGVLAGLYTKTNKLGFLSPGQKGGSGDGFPFAFWYGAKTVNPNIEFYYYNIGSFLDVDRTVAATNELIDMGCDMIGDTLDDFSSGNQIIARGLKALGTNGFDQRQVYGENVVFSYAYNWTKYFLPIVESVKNGSKNIKWYADFNINNDYNFYDLHFGYEISDEIKYKVNDQVKLLKNTTRAKHPYYCNSLMKEYATKWNFNMSASDSNICIATSNFFFFDNPFPGMTFLGYYNISLVEVEFPQSLQLGISIVSAVLIGIVLFMIAAIFKFRNTSSIRSASPVFLYFILSGAIIVYVGIIVWVSSLDTHVCNARLWLVTIGFSLLIGGLVVKNFRIWLIFDNPELKKVKITNYQLFPWVAGCLVINIILMSIITTVGDLKEIDAQGIDSLGKYEFMKVCKMNHGGASTLYTILAYFAVLLLAGVFVSWKIRIVDIDEFRESQTIANTLYAISFCLFVIVPLMISPQDKQSETIVLCTAGLFIVTAAIMIIFVPKFWRVYQARGTEDTSSMFRAKKSSSIATARAESMKSANSAGKRSNRRGVVSGDFSDDSESTISYVPNKDKKVEDVVSGAVSNDFTEEDASEFGGENEESPNGNDNNNNTEGNSIELSQLPPPQQD